jgi:Tol biopolymer transport system component
LLKADVGRIAPRGFARSGALYYLQTTSDLNVYKAELDPATGKLRGPAVPLASTYVGNNSGAALSPDGKQVAYLSARGAGRQFGARGGPGALTLVVKSLETQVEQTFPTELNIMRIRWAPDGRQLLVTAVDARRNTPLYNLDLETGRFSPMAATRNGATQGYEYFPANGMNEEWGSIVAVSLSSGEKKTIYRMEPGRVWNVLPSPDGRTLAAAVGTVDQKQTRSLVAMNPDGKEVRSLLESPDLRADSGIGWSADGKQVFFVRSGRPGDQPEVYRISVDGGEPIATGIRGRDLRHISLAGNTVTYTAGFENQVELWALDNLLPMLKASR